MDPAVAAFDFAKAGAIVANMIESYLAAGALPPNPEGADHVEHQDCRFIIWRGTPASTFGSRVRRKCASIKRAPSASTI